MRKILLALFFSAWLVQGRGVANLVNVKPSFKKIQLKKSFFKNLFDKFFHQDSNRRVWKVALSNDGTKLAAISGGYSAPQVHIWDLNNEYKEYASEQFSHEILTLAFSPDNKKLAIRDRCGIVRIFNVQSGELLLSIVTQAESEFICPTLLKFTPCSSKIVINNRSVIDIFDSNTGKNLHSLRGHASWIESLAFSQDGSMLASVAERDNFVRVWDMQTGEVKFTLSGEWNFPNPGFESVAFSHDGHYIAAGSGYKKVYIWNLHTGVRVHILEGHRSSIQSLVFSPDNLKLASGSSDATIHVWDVISGKELIILPHSGVAEKMTEIFFSNQGDRIISMHDRLIRIWDIRTGEKILLGKVGELNFYSLNVKNDILAAAGGEEAVYVWDLNKIVG